MSVLEKTWSAIAELAGRRESYEVAASVIKMNAAINL
jgi:hypothetical protein